MFKLHSMVICLICLMVLLHHLTHYILGGDVMTCKKHVGFKSFLVDEPRDAAALTHLAPDSDSNPVDYGHIQFPATVQQTGSQQVITRCITVSRTTRLLSQRDKTLWSEVTTSLTSNRNSSWIVTNCLVCAISRWATVHFRCESLRVWFSNLITSSWFSPHFLLPCTAPPTTHS